MWNMLAVCVQIIFKVYAGKRSSRSARGTSHKMLNQPILFMTAQTALSHNDQITPFMYYLVKSPLNKRGAGPSR